MSIYLNGVYLYPFWLRILATQVFPESSMNSSFYFPSNSAKCFPRFLLMISPHVFELSCLMRTITNMLFPLSDFASLSPHFTANNIARFSEPHFLSIIGSIILSLFSDVIISKNPKFFLAFEFHQFFLLWI